MRFIKFVFLMLFVVGGIVYLVEASDPRGRRVASKPVASQVAAAPKPQTWTEKLEDIKKKNDAKPKQAADPNWDRGFKTGYMAGFMLARGGSVKKQSNEIDGMSRRAATTAEMAEGVARSQFCRGYTNGFDFGWSKGR